MMGHHDGPARRSVVSAQHVSALKSSLFSVYYEVLLSNFVEVATP